MIVSKLCLALNYVLDLCGCLCASDSETHIFCYLCQVRSAVLQSRLARTAACSDRWLCAAGRSRWALRQRTVGTAGNVWMPSTTTASK